MSAPEKGKPPSDEEIVAQRMRAAAPQIPEVELASEVEFFENVRCSKDTRGRRTRIRLDDNDFRGGTIHVYPRQRMVVIFNPTADEVTREPITDRIPFDNVRHYELMTAAQMWHYYANPEERKARQDAADRRKREIAAAEAKARADVMAAEAAGT